MQKRLKEKTQLSRNISPLTEAKFGFFLLLLLLLLLLFMPSNFSTNPRKAIYLGKERKEAKSHFLLLTPQFRE